MSTGFEARPLLTKNLAGGSVGTHPSQAAVRVRSDREDAFAHGIGAVAAWADGPPGPSRAAGLRIRACSAPDTPAGSGAVSLVERWTERLERAAAELGLPLTV